MIRLPCFFTLALFLLPPAGGQSIQGHRTAGNAAQLTGALFDRHRLFLQQNGCPAAAIESPLEQLREQAHRQEVHRWNHYRTNPKPACNAEPNGFLVEMVKGLASGKALGTAMGQGRNGIWLARQGWDITGFGIACQAIAAELGVKLTAHIATVESFDFGGNRWDLILLTDAGGRGAAKPGGRACAPSEMRNRWRNRTSRQVPPASPASAPGSRTKPNNRRQNV